MKKLIDLKLENVKILAKFIAKIELNIDEGLYVIEYFEREGRNIHNAKKVFIDVVAKRRFKSEFSNQELVVEGPVKGYYSLAIVNRNFAKAMAKIFNKLILTSKNENVLDDAYTSNLEIIKERYVANYSSNSDSIHLFNSWPPDVNHMKGQLNGLHCYAWEETAYPLNYVKEFNNNLNFICVTAEFVRFALVNSGVNIPIFVVGNGVSVLERSKSIYKENEFTFLHISSCFARKGVEELIQAYSSAFTSNDNVKLIVKTFDNPDNIIDEVLSKYRKLVDSNFPNVEVIKKDFTEEELRELYAKADYVVYPTRGEGFLLTAAEAMLYQTPVITTNFGGQVDFCDEQTSILINTTIESSKSHVAEQGSFWAKADVVNLKEVMKQCFNGHDYNCLNRVRNAENLIQEKYTWDDVARRTVDAISNLNSILNNRIDGKRVALMSSWRQKCGIATYSEKILKDNYFNELNIDVLSHVISENHNVDSSKEEVNVHRIWNWTKDGLRSIVHKIISEQYDILFIQSHLGHYSYDDLVYIINSVADFNIDVVIEFHSDVKIHQPPAHAFEAFKKCSRLILHTSVEYSYFWSIDPQLKIAQINHPVSKLNYSSDVVKAKAKDLVISTFGFLMPHKRYELVIESVSLLRALGVNVRLVMLNSLTDDPKTHDYYSKIKDLILKHNLSDCVELNTDFLEMDEVHKKIKDASIIIFPYDDNGEAASGAITELISLDATFLVSPAKIFDSIQELVVRFDGYTAESIVISIMNIIKDKDLYSNKRESIRKYLDINSWENYRVRVLAIMKSIFDERFFGMNLVVNSHLNK